MYVNAEARLRVWAGRNGSQALTNRSVPYMHLAWPCARSLQH